MAGTSRSGRWLVAATLAVGFVLTPAAPADAFCGFYVHGADAKLFNEATQVVLMREGSCTVRSMQNDDLGPASDLATSGRIAPAWVWRCSSVDDLPDAGSALENLWETAKKKRSAAP